MFKPTSLLLAGVSVLAMSAVSRAQDLAVSSPTSPIVLDPITLVADGQGNVEATGGSVVTEQDIADMQPNDASELFARDSQVTVSGGAGPSKRIHVFGLEQSNLAVSVDGVPQFRDNWHHSGSNVVDPAFLKRVEVEAGAAAADAGFAAGAGAVRYETLGARDLVTGDRSQGGRVGLSYGSNGQGLIASLAGYGVYQDADWFVMLHRADGDNYENGDGYEVVGSEPATTGAILKTGYEFEGHRVELSYEYNKDEADRVTRMNMDIAQTKEVFPLKVTRNTLSLRYTEVTPTALWDPEVMIYASRNEYWRPNYFPGGFGDFAMDAGTVGGVAQNRFEVGPGSITAGVDWAYDDYEIDNYGDTDRRFHTLQTMQVGVFVQGRFEFDNGIDISTGARLDNQSFTDWNSERFTATGPSVNGTVSYEFAQGYEVFAGASQTWMGYDLGEYGYLHARPSTMVTDPGYQPATARNYKLGFNATQDNWTGNLTFFDTRLEDLANGYYRESDGSFTLDNAAEYRSRGVTLQGNYSWGSGRFGANLTTAHVEYDGEDALPNGGDAMPIGTVASLFVDQDIPQHNMRVGATLELADRLDGDYLTEAGFSDHAGYGVVNAYAEWRPATYENVVVRLGVDNLLDKTYYERSSYVQYSPRDVEPLYAPGRTVTLGLNLDF